ncbi:MAG: M23 family metallopeptidase [Ferruginibacter sp.]
MKKELFLLFLNLCFISGIHAQCDKFSEAEALHLTQIAKENFKRIPELKKWLTENNHTENYSTVATHVLFSWPMRVNSNYDDIPEYYNVSNYMDINRDDPNAGEKDWYCKYGSSALNYRYHEGNDYSVYPFNWRMMNNRNAYAAAGAAGIVLAVRDSIDNDHNCIRDENENNSPNYVAILHSDSSITRYLHLKTGSALVSVGQFVEEGQRLGNIGSSGHSSNPHLHFDLQYFRISDNSYNFVEPFYKSSDASCNPFTSDTWWRNQKTFLTPKMIRVMTHSGTPVLQGDINSTYNPEFCPEFEDAKPKNQFAPGELLVVGVALGHVNYRDSVHLSFYYPDGTLWLSTGKPVPDTRDGSPVNFRKKIYITHSTAILSSAPSGTYKIVANFTYRPFYAADPYNPQTTPVTTTTTHFFTIGCDADKTLSGYSYGTAGFIVSNSINSTQIIDGGKTIYQSANYIKLNPGFTATAGVTFKARIRSCNYCD